MWRLEKRKGKKEKEFFLQEARSARRRLHQNHSVPSVAPVEIIRSCSAVHAAVSLTTLLHSQPLDRREDVPVLFPIHVEDA